MSNGMFTVTGVPAGVYTLKASATGFFAYSYTINVTADINAGTYADFHLSPVLPANTYRAVLTWGAWPAGKVHTS
jgi:hypothetical protein